MPVLPRVLFVDDERALLDGLRRVLRGRYDLETAGSGAEALRMIQRAIDNKRPFQVIVSDMQMPQMNGAALLAQVRELDPDAVRMIMSGHADLASTIDAVNEGGIVHFLTKPFETDDLTRLVDEAAEHYRMVVAERELLEGTLRATVDLLADVLAIAVPVAYSRTTRLVALTDAAARRLAVKDWQLPIAARLSHLGCFGIPAELLLTLDAGETLTPHERELYLGHPAAAETMLRRIPRLETVAAWVGSQPLQGEPPREDAETAELVLHAASAVLHTCDAGHDAQAALAEVRAREVYPTAILDAFAPALHALTPEGSRREVTAHELGPGMVLEDDIVSATGTVLVRKGERLSRTLAQRVREFADTVGVKEPIRVIVHGFR